MIIHTLIYTQSKHLTDSTRKDLELLKKAANLKGHTLKVVFARDCQLALGQKPQVLINGKKENIKILLVRANFLSTNLEFRCALIKQFQLAGINVINKSSAVLIAKDKLRTMQVLGQKKIAIPKTYVVVNTENINKVVKDIGSLPLILKAVTGSHGSGVAIVESLRGLRSVTAMMIGDSGSNPIIVQEYVKESKGKDVRVFIVGKKIVGVMERIAKKRGEFRSNFQLGGRVRVAELSRKEKDMAFAAVKACGLDIAGVDMLRTNKGPKILEVNANPGLEGITQATGIDVAGKIIAYTVKKVKRNKK